jgi:hypothetical protein
MKYDSKRILTVHEMRKGDKLHGGIIAGKCVKWEVVETFSQSAILRCGETSALVFGKDLREFAWYFENDCVACAFNHEVEPQPLPELHEIPRELLAADIPSSFRFRAAQYRGIKKTR